MRLDEWQKYIEAQFLDDGDTESAPQSNSVLQPSAQELPKPFDGVGPSHVAPIATEPEDLAANSKGDLAQSALEFDESPDTVTESDAARHLDFTPSESMSPSSRSDASPRSQISVGFGSAPDYDIPIPAFDSYLPATRRPARVESSSEIEANANQLTSTESAQCQAPPRIANVVHTTVGTIGAAHHGPGSASVPDENVSISNPVVKRTPKSRARHAKNVRPDHVPSGLSAGELWAQVPKHVQTLLALERMEEEQEVAQFSYKRPFQEKRHELIERLLDPILSLEDAARLLNVCPTTVRRYTNKGILTYYRKEQDRVARADVRHNEAEDASTSRSEKETRQRRFRLSDILAFLETQQAALQADRKAEQSDPNGLSTIRTQELQEEQSRSLPEPPMLSAPMPFGKA